VDTTDAAQTRPSAEGLSEQSLKIFINYRHDDVPFAASALYRELRRSFGQENIFFDEGALRPGMRFPEEIRSHLTKGSGAFIAMIGSEWASILATRRQRGGLDYVTKEIELALQNNWIVIPVLVENARLPDPAELPPAIRALPDCQVARLRQMNLDEDIEVLTRRLTEIDEARQQEPSPSPVTSARRTREASPPAVAGRPADPGESAAVPMPDDEHYQMLIDEADNLVIFLGAEANADDRDGPFREGAAMLPDDTDLAEYLATKIKLQPGLRELATVAQHVRMMRGEPNVFRWVKEILGVEASPGPVHRYLARLPKRLEELGLEKRYQMIVTPKLDLALEQAFRDEGEPFDVAIYMAPGTEYAGRFVHLSWGHAEPRPVMTPNEYEDFPMVKPPYGELTRTLIVRTSGGVDDLNMGYRWQSNFVITEDHYIDYLGGRPAAEVVPSQILAKLKHASYLFLGYPIADWRLRVFLHWIWQGERFGGATHWAVERNPDPIEQRFWRAADVCLYRCRLSDYVQQFDDFLQGSQAREDEPA
jgi:SIR2-like domain/TIR domain